MNIDDLQASADAPSPTDRPFCVKPLGGPEPSTPNTSAPFLHHHQQQQFLRYSGLGATALTPQPSPIPSSRPLAKNGLLDDHKNLFCHPPPTALECSVKSEPCSEANKFQSSPLAQSLPYEQQIESSRAADKLYPLVIAEYYMNPILFIDDNKEKVTAQCKRCGRPVTGWWSPRLVTSNFITHLKSCSVELYQHFLETKKRCGWTARRYTVKLRADTGVVAPWRSDISSKVMLGLNAEEGGTSHSDGRSPSEEAAVLDAVADQCSEEAKSTRGRLGHSAHLLRNLASFATEDFQPPGGVLSGAVERLLLRFGVRAELPTEERLRSYLIDHESIIRNIAFDGLPALDKSSVLLGVHSSIKQDCLACIVCFWSCSIGSGQLHKRLFSVRRYGNLETALEQAPRDLRRARRFQRGLSDANDGAEGAASEPAVVLSRQPAAYLRIPSFCRELKTASDLSLPASEITGLPHRVIEDVPQQLWGIYIGSLRQVDALSRLLDLALEHLTSAVLEPAASLGEPGECSFFATQLRLLSRLTDEGARPSQLFDRLEAATGINPPELHRCLTALLSMGQYFASAVQRLHGRGVTISNLLPLLLGLQKKAGAPESASEPILVGTLRQVVVGQLEATLQRYSSAGDATEPSLFLLATFADPQYKLFWVEDVEQEKGYREKIIKHLSRRLPKAATSNATSTLAEQPEVDDGLLDFVAKRRRLAMSEAGCEWPLVDEVNNYLVNKDVAPALEFWASERRQGIFPNIFKLHREVHAVALSCFDAGLDIGLSSDLLCDALGPGRWARESSDVLELLSLAKCYAYDFSGRPRTRISTPFGKIDWPTSNGTS